MGDFYLLTRRRPFLDTPATAIGTQSVLESRQISLPGPTFNARTSQQLLSLAEFFMEGSESPVLESVTVGHRNNKLHCTSRC